MKVLYLTYSPAPYRVEFFEELGKLVNLTVCYEITPGEDKTKRNSGWYNNSSKNFNCVFLKNKYIFGKYVSNGMIKILSKENFDIVVIGGYSSLTAIISMLYLKMKKITFIINTDGGFPKLNENALKKFIKSRLLLMGNYYLSTGENANKYLQYYGVDKRRILNYPFTNIRDKEKINKVISNKQREKIKHELNMNEKWILLYVGQFIPRKGIDILINASIGLPNDVGIYIIGDKPKKDMLCLAQKNKNIHFLDYIPKAELMNYFLASDLFVFPTREDIWGLVVVEALTYALPVLTTDRCGAGLDLIRNGYNGYIIESDNVLSLKKQLNSILKNKDKIETMRKNALDSVKGYSIEKEANRHFQIFNQILKHSEQSEVKRK